MRPQYIHEEDQIHPYNTEECIKDLINHSSGSGSGLPLLVSAYVIGCFGKVGNTIKQFS